MDAFDFFVQMGLMGQPLAFFVLVADRVDLQPFLTV